MSKLLNSPITQETSPQVSGLPLPTWRVKLSNGAVYGPIALDELRTWAAECRLAPDDQVSSDTGNWANAETMPELTMQWMVEMASGEIFGPIHLHAVVDFYHSRLVLPSSRLTNRVTGKKSTVADLVLPLIPDAERDDFLAGAPVVADSATSTDRLIKFSRNTSATRLPPDQQKEKLQLQATVDESESRIKQWQSDLDSQQAQTLKLHDDKAALEKTYLVKLGNAQKNYDVAAHALEKAEAQVRALRDDQVRREKELGERISSFSGQTQDSSGQIAEKNNVVSRLETELIKTRGDFEAGMRDIQDRLGRATSDYDSTLNNIREKELSLSAAVRERDLALQSVRALTERYEARVKEFDVQIDALADHKQTFEREIEMRQNKIKRLNTALAEKEQHGANAARDRDSVRSEKESRIQTLTRPIEVLTADQTAAQANAQAAAQAVAQAAAQATAQAAAQAAVQAAAQAAVQAAAQAAAQAVAQAAAQATAQATAQAAAQATAQAAAQATAQAAAQTAAQAADQTAMRSALEQNRAKFEQARQETQKLVTRAKELNKRTSVFDSQIKNMSENLAASEDNIAGQRERIEVMTGEHPPQETQLQTSIEERTGRLNPELERVRGELTGRAADIKGMSERVISMENSVTAAGNEAEQPKLSCQGVQEQPGQTEGECKRHDPGYLEKKSMLPPVPNRQKMKPKTGKKVLVVEDSEVIQQLITQLAETHGASVTAVASAKDVIGILAEKPCRFALIILDLTLSEITGWETLGILRSRPETKDTPIVILTGPLSSKEKEKILRKADAVIEKSKFTLADFNQILNQWL